VIGVHRCAITTAFLCVIGVLTVFLCFSCCPVSGRAGVTRIALSATAEGTAAAPRRVPGGIFAGDAASVDSAAKMMELAAAGGRHAALLHSLPRDTGCSSGTERGGRGPSARGGPFAYNGVAGRRHGLDWAVAAMFLLSVPSLLPGATEAAATSAASPAHPGALPAGHHPQISFRIGRPPARAQPSAPTAAATPQPTPAPGASSVPSGVTDGSGAAAPPPALSPPPGSAPTAPGSGSAGAAGANAKVGTLRKGGGIEEAVLTALEGWTRCERVAPLNV